MIALVDYGMGNIRSVEKALQHLGRPVKLTSKPEDLDKALKAFEKVGRELGVRK